MRRTDSECKKFTVYTLALQNYDEDIIFPQDHAIIVVGDSGWVSPPRVKTSPSRQMFSKTWSTTCSVTQSMMRWVWWVRHYSQEQGKTTSSMELKLLY